MDFWRNITHTAVEIDHGGHRYTVELRIFSLGRNLTLYRDGDVVERASAPATFVLEDGAGDGAVIDVGTSEYGFQRAVLRRDGTRTPLHPAEGTWEDWRRRWGQRHPVASRVVAVTSGGLVLASLVLGLMELLELLTGASWARALLGGWSFTSPVELPGWFLWVFGLVVGAAALERALRMR